MCNILQHGCSEPIRAMHFMQLVPRVGESEQNSEIKVKYTAMYKLYIKFDVISRNILANGFFYHFDNG